MPKKEEIRKKKSVAERRAEIRKRIRKELAAVEPVVRIDVPVKHEKTGSGDRIVVLDEKGTLFVSVFWPDHGLKGIKRGERIEFPDQLRKELFVHIARTYRRVKKDELDSRYLSELRIHGLSGLYTKYGKEFPSEGE